MTSITVMGIIVFLFMLLFTALLSMLLYNIVAYYVNTANKRDEDKKDKKEGMHYYDWRDDWFP